MNAATNTSQTADTEFVVLSGVSREAYEKIVDALGEFHLRHSYDRGSLEMRRLLHGVPRQSYQRLLDALPEHYLRHTYDGWTLEMMTPTIDHEWVKGLLGRMLGAMSLALDIPVQSTGSVTLSGGDRGLQPDESYYIGRRVPVRGAEACGPGANPPPDLAIEVDVTNTSVPRLPIYAQIGVPEIWRYQEGQVRFYRLSAGQYEPIERSVAFPFVSPADMTRFLEQRHETDDNSVVRGFVNWATEARRTSS
jgi:Uma2 family endonuclease